MRLEWPLKPAVHQRDLGAHESSDPLRSKAVRLSRRLRVSEGVRMRVGTRERLPALVQERGGGKDEDPHVRAAALIMTVGTAPRGPC